MNSTAQHSLSPLVQYNQVISSCFLYSIYGKKSAFVRGLNKSCIMYYLKLTPKFPQPMQQNVVSGSGIF